MTRIGVLVMSYGTPRGRDDIATYYTDIRRGRPPTQELLADLTARYDAIGGTFPLRAITDAQIAAIAAALGDGYAVAGGTKHSVPSIPDGVAQLAAAGVGRVVGLVLAPHYSRASIGDYAARLAAAADGHGLPSQTVESWHLMPAYVDFLARAVSSALSTLPTGSEVVFTAHSLPVRVADDTYPRQLQETAAAVAAAAGAGRWSVGWQSAGRTGDEWLGPDILDILRDRAAAGAAGVAVCACGFVADHLEVVYDLDIEAAAVAAELDLPFARTASVNDEGPVMAGLAQLVTQVSA